MIPAELPATFERRILVNYRIDPDVAARAIPAPFSPDLVSGRAVGGLCVVHLRVGLPAPRRPLVSVAHRFAVRSPDGTPGVWVYVPRRDTSSMLAALLGGRVVPGVQHRAWIDSTFDAGLVDVDLSSRDRRMRVQLRAHVEPEHDPRSVYTSTAAASVALRGAPLGYSRARSAHRLEVVELCSDDWSLTPLAIEHVASSYFDDRRIFPDGTIEPDSAFVMTDVAHRWRTHRARAIAPT